MFFSAHTWMGWLGTALAGAAAAYSVAASIAVLPRMRALAQALPKARPAITILKPLCGAEHELYQSLRSFCRQDYPRYEIVFGVSDGDDPAVGVVSRLMLEFPALDIRLAVDRRQHGSSRKVSNLINMLPFAHYDYLVISDSDVRVERDYLSKLAPTLVDPAVGVITCPYRGNPAPGLWSLLGSLFINEWFIPSVRVAAMCGSRAFAFGATIGIRRAVLARIGGFGAIANQLADDYRLGELTRSLGLSTVLSGEVVETCVDERTFGELIRHELRWLRTIRALRPVSYSLMFVTFGVPVALFGSILTGGGRIALVLLAVTAIGRCALHFRLRRPSDPAPAYRFFVLPLRDGLSLALWGWGFVTRRVHWRDDSYRVTRDGSVQPVVRITP